MVNIWLIPDIPWWCNPVDFAFGHMNLKVGWPRLRYRMLPNRLLTGANRRRKRIGVCHIDHQVKKNARRTAANPPEYWTFKPRMGTLDMVAGTESTPRCSSMTHGLIEKLENWAIRRTVRHCAKPCRKMTKIVQPQRLDTPMAIDLEMSCHSTWLFRPPLFWAY